MTDTSPKRLRELADQSTHPLSIPLSPEAFRELLLTVAAEKEVFGLLFSERQTARVAEKEAAEKQEPVATLFQHKETKERALKWPGGVAQAEEYYPNWGKVGDLYLAPQPVAEKDAQTTVDAGALRMALNVLRRAGKYEVADALESSAFRGQKEAQPVTYTPINQDHIHILPKGYEHMASVLGAQPEPSMSMFASKEDYQKAVEAQQRERMNARFANCAPSPPTADFDLPHESDNVEVQPFPDPFIVKHYSGDERPVIKGNGFDGLEIGETREEAEEFVAWVNAKLKAQPSTADVPMPAPPKFCRQCAGLEFDWWGVAAFKCRGCGDVAHWISPKQRGAIRDALASNPHAQAIDTASQADVPMPAPDAWDGLYREKCVDGTRCLNGCHSNERCCLE